MLPVLPAGSCNLYLFPRIALGRGVARKKSASNKLEDHAQEASDEDQVLLKRLLLATFETTSGSLMDQTDQSGAYPIHALMVGNTDASLALSLDLFRASPALLTRTHGTGPFEGESSLIIAIVNRREDVVLTMLELAKKLPEDRRDDFLRAQPTGPFFSDLPMLHFGGTPLGYACVFELRQAVLEMLRLGLDLNDEPCTATGFLPIHALVANSKLEMIDWVTELPDMPLKSARRVETAQVGLHATCNYHGQSALQLAASLGDHRTFKHLLMKQTSVDGARSIFEDDEDDGEYGVGGYEDPEPEIEISTSGSFIVETVKDGGGRRRRRRTPFQVPWEAAPTASRPSEAEASPPSRRSSFSGAAVDRLERKLDDVLGALASARRVSVEAQLIAAAPLPAPPVEVAARRGSALNANL